MIKSVDHVLDAKIYLAKHAQRAFKSGNVEFAAVLHCCPTLAGDIKTEDEEGNEVSPEVNKLLQVFSGVFEELTSLPSQREVDHAIELLPGQKPPVRPPQRLLQSESQVVQNQVDELLCKGLIEPSISPFASPVLVVKHRCGKMRMCIDYCGLNAVTVKNRFQMPGLEEILDGLLGYVIFSQIDL